CSGENAVFPDGPDPYVRSVGLVRMIYSRMENVMRMGEPDKLGTAARRAIDANDVLVSPAAVLELELLHEIGRLRPTASKLIGTLANDIGLRACELSFRIVVEHALKENWG